MEHTDREAQDLWSRSDLVHLPGTVKRLSESFISIALPAPYAPVTVRWEGAQPMVGDAVVVAGEECIGDVAGKGLRVFVVQCRADSEPRLVLTARPISSPKPPETAQPWLNVLVRNGLLDNEERVPSDLFGADPVGVLCSVHESTAARDKGFVHFDWKWWNDTDDVVADLAVITGHAQSFALLGARREQLEFEVRRADGTTMRETVHVEGGDLDELAVRMNYWLGQLGAERRIWIWDAGGDELAFLGRSPSEVDAMADAGLPTEGLELAGNEKEADWTDI